MKEKEQKRERVPLNYKQTYITSHPSWICSDLVEKLFPIISIDIHLIHTFDDEAFVEDDDDEITTCSNAFS